MNPWKDKAWIVPASSECDDTARCRIAFDHPSCSYRQPAVLLDIKIESLGLAADTPFGSGDARGGLIQHIGSHKAALENAGWRVVEGLGEVLASEGLLLGVRPDYLDDLPSAAD